MPRTSKDKTKSKAKATTTASDFFTALCRSDLKAECVKEFRFHPIRKWRFDYALPDHLLAIEVEGGVWSGGRHIRPRGFLGDMEKYNAASALGWRVLRVTPDTLHSSATLELIRQAIATAGGYPELDKKPIGFINFDE